MGGSTTWKSRAKRVGFKVWKNQKLSEAAEEYVKDAFDGLAEKFGIHYIWY